MFRLPEVKATEESPPGPSQAAASCDFVELVYTDAVEWAPLSEPANDPVTVAVPPGPGTVRPRSPAPLGPATDPENDAVVGAIELGVHVTTVPCPEGPSPSTLAQPLVPAATDFTTVPEITWDTSDPVVVHPVAVSEN